MRLHTLSRAVTTLTLATLLLGAAPSDDAPTDPVPEALERMKPWPGLSDAVTGVVMNSPKGRIHGHDAERIELTVDEPAGTAEVRFVMPASFPLHGHRTVSCTRTGTSWSCTDTSPAR